MRKLHTYPTYPTYPTYEPEEKKEYKPEGEKEKEYEKEKKVGAHHGQQARARPDCVACGSIAPVEPSPAANMVLACCCCCHAQPCAPTSPVNNGVWPNSAWLFDQANQCLPL
jgi:hypothetical protein